RCRRPDEPDLGNTSVGRSSVCVVMPLEIAPAAFFCWLLIKKGLTEMPRPTTETNGAQSHTARENGTAPSQHNSRKVYVPGSTPEMRVPMREVALTPTRTPTGQLETNPPLRLYDTSGPYTDPTFTPDLQQGLPAQRRAWILRRSDVETLPEPSSAYRKQREADPMLASIRFPSPRKPLRAKSGQRVTQLH